VRLYIKLAWRNVLRNKRRTFIAGTAIGIGLAALIYTDALVVGMERNMIRAATASFLGEGQIHSAAFRETFAIDQTVNNSGRVVAGLESDTLVQSFTTRTLAFAMISSPANMTAVTMVGVDPRREPDLSQVDEAIIEGNFLDGGGERDILIGNKLAELLEVRLGDRVVVTAAQAHTGDLAQEMFRISGIFFLNIAEMDQSMAFVRLGKAQSMLDLGTEVHEIAITFVDPKYSRNTALPFWDAYSTDGNQALGWPEILPELKAAFELSRFSTVLVGLILFGVVALGIVNTLFMSLYERMYEFGVMRAVGTSPFAIGRLIVLEAGALAVVSIVLGVILGFVATYISMRIGFDYGGIDFAGVTFTELLYPVMQVSQFIYYPIAVFLFTALVSLYPASFAARIIPAAAMRKSL